MIRMINKELAIEAVEWFKKQEELQKAVADHAASCKHWTTVMNTEQNRDPQFPDTKTYTCEWCKAQLTL